MADASSADLAWRNRPLGGVKDSRQLVAKLGGGGGVAPGTGASPRADQIAKRPLGRPLPVGTYTGTAPSAKHIRSPRPPAHHGLLQASDTRPADRHTQGVPKPVTFTSPRRAERDPAGRDPSGAPAGEAHRSSVPPAVGVGQRPGHPRRRCARPPAQGSSESTPRTESSVWTQHVLGGHEAHPVDDAEVEYLSDVGVRERGSPPGLEHPPRRRAPGLSSASPPTRQISTRFSKPWIPTSLARCTSPVFHTLQTLEEPILSKHDLESGHVEIVCGKPTGCRISGEERRRCPVLGVGPRSSVSVRGSGCRAPGECVGIAPSALLPSRKGPVSSRADGELEGVARGDKTSGAAATAALRQRSECPWRGSG